MVRGSIAKYGLSKTMVYICGICSLMVRVNSFLCVKCGKWMCGGCAGLKNVTQQFVDILLAGKVKEVLEK